MSSNTEDIRNSFGQNPNKLPDDPYSDNKRIYPYREYDGAPTTNLAARGIETNELYIGGGDIDLDLELKSYPSSQYPLNQVRKTVSGHVTEIDDTPGRERMLFRHKTGAGIELRADGTVVVSATNNTIRVSGGDEKVIIEGNGHLVYHGDLKLRVDGDFDLDVGGNINVTAGGDKMEDIKGGFRQDVNRNHQTFVNRNMSQTITGSNTTYVAGNNNNIIKGANSVTIGDNSELIIGKEYQVSAENKIIMTTADMNVGASNMTFIGDSGTIGGENIIMYNYNMYTGHSITAGDTVTVPTVYGDLQGTATQAMISNQAGLHPSSGAHAGSGYGYTASATSVDTKATVLPTNSVIKNDWFNSEYGLFKVAIDAGNIIYNTINRLFDYGGVSERTLNTQQVRSKLRDGNNQKNVKFIGTSIAEGILSSKYASQIPPNIGDTIHNDATPRNPNPKEVFGRLKGAEAKRYAGTVLNKDLEIYVNPVYDPVLKEVINSRTKLARGITISKFLGGYGDPVTLDHMTAATKLETAKNLYLHGQLMRSIMEDEGEFDEFRLVVAEGVYKKGINETLEAGGINDLAQTGRAIVYELRGRNGKIALKQTFRLAAWWKDSQQYEKLILDYDTYNPNGSLNVQLVVIMPELKNGYITRFNNKLETRFNNYIQSTNELVEILET